MATSTFDEKQLKQILKSALREALEEQRELVREIVDEALEDIGLARAIDVGLSSPSVTRQDVFSHLEQQN